MLAIIGGSGLSRLRDRELLRATPVQTPYANEPITLETFAAGNGEVIFLPRHGSAGAVPPHRVNYRANIWALKQAGVRRIVGINVVGGIHPDMGPGALMVPDQLIDYTHGRAATFFEDDLETAVHIEFGEPFDPTLRAELLNRLATVNASLAQPLALLDSGVYGCTQGPRLETAAEIQRLRRDGCDIVGMTAMPEAALARELGIAYALLALSVNWAAGLSEEAITMAAIQQVIEEGMGTVLDVLSDWH